jgi:hypothetical protein
MTLTHWGAFRAHAEDDQVVDVEPLTHDPDPSPIGRSLEAVTRSRVMRPAVRRSWMEGGPGTATHLRGAEPFVEVDWDTALDLVAAELERVRTTHGNQAIYGGSYGWSSPGRFHHAQSQIHRFLATIGGIHALGEHLLAGRRRGDRAACPRPLVGRHPGHAHVVAGDRRGDGRVRGIRRRPVEEQPGAIRRSGHPHAPGVDGGGPPARVPVRERRSDTRRRARRARRVVAADPPQHRRGPDAAL